MPDPSIHVLSGMEAAFALRLLIAAVLGSILGLERSLAGKHAGMRTYALVALGSALFVVTGTLASYQLGGLFTRINPLQIASSVVVGIGFIGAGLAAFRGEHPGELTTGAGLWVVAAVGMAAGYGFYIIALTTTVLSLLVLTVLSGVENRLRARFGVEGK